VNQGNTVKAAKSTKKLQQLKEFKRSKSSAIPKGMMFLEITGNKGSKGIPSKLQNQQKNSNI